MKPIRGLIRYVCPVDTIAPSLGSIMNVSLASFPLRKLTLAGDVQSIYLPFYEAFKKKFKDNVVVNNSHGYAGKMPRHETLFYNSQDIFLFTIVKVPEFYAHPNLVNQKAVYDALIQAGVEGTKISFYPDINNKPNEVFVCAMPNRADEKREGHILQYTFKFKLEHIDAAGLPVVPGFAP